MKARYSEVKKGEKATPLAMYPAAQDELHFWGEEKEVKAEIAQRKLTIHAMATVSGDMAPRGYVYGTAR
jgi:hypothetical protein